MATNTSWGSVKFLVMVLLTFPMFWMLALHFSWEWNVASCRLTKQESTLCVKYIYIDKQAPKYVIILMDNLVTPTNLLRVSGGQILFTQWMQECSTWIRCVFCLCYLFCTHWAGKLAFLFMLAISLLRSHIESMCGRESQCFKPLFQNW